MEKPNADIKTEDIRLDNLSDDEMDNIGLETETDDSEESQTETNQEEKSPSQEGENQDEKKSDNIPDDKQIPFHEHPRFKELVEEKNNYKSQLEEMRNEIENLKQPAKQEQPTDAPQWFVNTFGGGVNDEATNSLWKEYNNHNQAQQEAIIQRTIEKIKTEQAQEARQSQEAKDYVENQIKEIESTGKKVDRKELIRVINDYRPIDEQGNWNIKKAFQILEFEQSQQKKDKNQKQDAKSIARRKIAEIDTKPIPESGEETTLGWHQIRKMDWF